MLQDASNDMQCREPGRHLLRPQLFFIPAQQVLGPAGTKLSDKFTGSVTEVVSGDTLVVKDAASKVERRINLSSIRAARLGRKGEKPEDWALEAKEFLRSRLIGECPSLSLVTAACPCTLSSSSP